MAEFLLEDLGAGGGRTMIQTALFGKIDLDTMTESDVEQIIVRPLLHALGYRHGTENNIRTQANIKYTYSFLGHKNKKRDPALIGRPDFICEAIPYGRWVIEAKSPQNDLCLEDSEQAYSYAAHPSIAAEHYVLTNGRQFRVYRIGNPNDPILMFDISKIDEMQFALENLLCPNAVRNRALTRLDIGKPIIKGGKSNMEIVGGNIIYRDHSFDNAFFAEKVKIINGLRNSVSGISIRRTDDGLISASVKILSANSNMDIIHRAMSVDTVYFNSVSEYISDDIEYPTYFSSSFSTKMTAGTEFPDSFGHNGGRLPFTIECFCFAEALGCLRDRQFNGSASIEYDYRFHTEGTQFEPIIGKTAKMRGNADFEILLI